MHIIFWSALALSVIVDALLEEASIHSIQEEGVASCDAEDALLEKWTCLRFAVLGCLMLMRVNGIRRAGLADATKKPFAHHPKLTAKLQESTNLIAQLFYAQLLWVQEEGVGFAIYFAVSAAMDNFSIFAVDHTRYCEAATAAALYSMALLSFLPTVFVSLQLQAPWYSNGEWCTLGYGKTRFVAFMVVTTMISFVCRLLVVYRLGWIDQVQHWLLELEMQWRVVVAGLIPPLVDGLQTIALVLVGARADNSYKDASLMASETEGDI
jgi:hypothetical protein